MVNPHEPTNFSRTADELEEFFLFCICVAGKNAEQQAVKLDTFLRFIKGRRKISTFEAIAKMWVQDLRAALIHSKLGKYDLLSRGFRYAARELSQDALRNARWSLLEMVPGVSWKTAKFFILHSRPAQKIAVLDTYVLKFLKQRFPTMRVPKSSPQHPDHYEVLESLFLAECFRLGVSPEVADLTCWRSRGATIDPTQLHKYVRTQSESFTSAHTAAGR